MCQPPRLFTKTNLELSFNNRLQVILLSGFYVRMHIRTHCLRMGMALVMNNIINYTALKD